MIAAIVFINHMLHMFIEISDIYSGNVRSLVVQKCDAKVKESITSPCNIILSKLR